MRFRKTNWVLALSIILAIFIPVLIAFAESNFSSSPPDGRTGAPGETDCTGCHATYPLNSGDGTLQLVSLPATMTAGQTLSITVQLEDPGQQRWGFEMTAIDESNNGVGQFVITDAVNTQLSDGTPPARDYAKHTSTGTYSGTADGPVSWTVNYEASGLLPDDYVYFYVAGNAANAGDGNSNDYIYTYLDSVLVVLAPHIPTTNLVGIIILITMLIGTTLFVYLRKRTVTA